jgi:hypothetical protein
MRPRNRKLIGPEAERREVAEGEPTVRQITATLTDASSNTSDFSNSVNS